MLYISSFPFSLENRKKKNYATKARLRKQAAIEKKLAQQSPLDDVAIDIHPIQNDFDAEEAGNNQSTVVRVCPESLDRVAE